MTYNFQYHKHSEFLMNSYIGILIGLVIIMFALLWYDYAYAATISDDLAIISFQQTELWQSLP